MQKTVLLITNNGLYSLSYLRPVLKTFLKSVMDMFIKCLLRIYVNKSLTSLKIRLNLRMRSWRNLWIRSAGQERL